MNPNQSVPTPPSPTIAPAVSAAQERQGPSQSPSHKAPQMSRGAGSRKRKVLLGVCLLLILCGTAGIVVLQSQAGGEADNVTTAEDVARFKKAAAEGTARLAQESDDSTHHDEQLEKAVLGEWELPEDGTYRLILKPDHTGTLIYKPNLKYKILLGWTDRLEIQIRWELENGHMDMWSLSGKPETAFKIAIKDRGDRKYYQVKEVSPQRLVLHELKNGKVDHWRKIH